MTYELGIDAGTTYTAAAVRRDGKLDIVPLGDHSAAIPSVIFLKEDGSILTGDAANRRALTEPQRVALQFKRRIGDSTPILLGGTPYSAEALLAKLLRWTVDHVTRLEGGPPDSVAVTHPANWGAYKLDRLDQAIKMADLDGATTLTEPESAAIYYASNERVESGSIIAVYDLGGGTFDAAVLRKTGSGWEILGTPEGIDQLGGIDVDEAVFSHVRDAAAGAFATVDIDDRATVAAISRLRRDCVEAKEALSSDTDVSIAVLLPNHQTEVRMTRSELETMIRPTLQDTVGAMQRALRSAAVQPEEVTAVLLVGGSSRIPMVAQLVSAEFGRPVAVDAHPKNAVALGAALAAAADTESHGTRPLPVPPPVVPEPPPVVPEPPPVDPEPIDERDSERSQPAHRSWRPSQTRLGAGLVVLVVGIALTAWFVNRDDPPPPPPVQLSTGRSVPTGAFPDGIAADEDGRLWVASTAGAEVSRIDPITGVRNVVSLPPGSDPLAVAVTDDGGVWVSLRNQAQIVRLDPDTMETTDIPVTPRPAAFGIGAGSLWVLSGDGAIERVNPTSREIEVSIPLPSPTGITITGESAWVTGGAENAFITEIDLETNAPGRTIAVGQQPDSIAVDDDGVLWVTNRGAGSVSRVDPATEEVTNVPVGTSPANIAVDGDRVWVTDHEEGKLVLLDRERVEVAGEIDVGERPLDLAVVGDSVWVSVTQDDAVVEVRSSTEEPAGPLTLIDDIREEGGRFVFDYEPVGFEPVKDTADDEVFHVHFFWNTLAAVNAGSNGPDPGAWLLWDEPFTVSDPFFDIGNRPEGASAICSVVANRSHGIADVDDDGTPDPATGNCLPIPDV